MTYLNATSSDIKGAWELSDWLPSHSHRAMWWKVAQAVEGSTCEPCVKLIWRTPKHFIANWMHMWQCAWAVGACVCMNTCVCVWVYICTLSAFAYFVHCFLYYSADMKLMQKLALLHGKYLKSRCFPCHNWYLSQQADSLKHTSFSCFAKVRKVEMYLLLFNHILPQHLWRGPGQYGSENAMASSPRLHMKWCYRTDLSLTTHEAASTIILMPHIVSNGQKALLPMYYGNFREVFRMCKADGGVDEQLTGCCWSSTLTVICATIASNQCQRWNLLSLQR